MAEIKQVLDNLRNEELEIREEGLKQIREFNKELSTKEIATLLEAATEKFPEFGMAFNDSNQEIFQVLAKNVSDEHIPFIVEVFPKYDGQTKLKALQLLGQLDSQKAAITMVKLLKLSATELEFKFGTGYLIRGRSRYADIFFPDLFEFIKIEALTGHILKLCLNCFREGLLDIGELDNHSNLLVSLSESYREQVRLIEKDKENKWIWKDEYLSIRGDFVNLVDLFGYFTGPETDQELTIVSMADDPQIRMYAIISRLRKGMNIDVHDIAPIAAYSETRMWLYKMLLSLDKANLFPQEFISHEAFAESDMVNWLSFGTELGKVPDEIELMKVFELDTNTAVGKILYYLYRYRTFPPHWAAKNGWMAGVSGPIIMSEEPSPDGYIDTFSAFRSWDSQTPEEHLGNVHEILDRWRKSEAKKS